MATKTAINLNEKLLAIQTNLFVPKEQSNSFGGYNYRSCEDIEKAIKPLLKEYNCTLILFTSIEEIGGRLFVKATASLIDNVPTDEAKTGGLNVSAYAEIGESKKGMDQAQLTGAATSYARKYALAGMFLIDNEKDSDATNKHEGAEKSAEKPKKDPEVAAGINEKQITAIRAELDRTGVSESVILESVKKKDLKDMTQAEYVQIMKRLNKTSDKES